MSMAREIRAAWLGLRRDKALTLVVVLMLATAIAATTTIFSIVHAVLLRPLPFTDPDRVVLAWTRNDAQNALVIEVSLGELREWRARTSSLASVDVFGSVNWSYRITAPGEPFGVTYNSVSGSFFETLGARPMLGRTFRPEDDAPGAPATVVLSAHLWRRRFSSDPSIVGKSITIGEGAKALPAEIIGASSPRSASRRSSRTRRSSGRARSAFASRSAHSRQTSSGCATANVAEFNRVRGLKVENWLA
jgi:putative ABC transport system permease protein